MAALMDPLPTRLDRPTPAQTWQVAAHEVEQHRLRNVVCIVPCMQQPGRLYIDQNTP